MPKLEILREEFGSFRYRIEHDDGTMDEKKAPAAEVRAEARRAHKSFKRVIEDREGFDHSAPEIVMEAADSEEPAPLADVLEGVQRHTHREFDHAHEHEHGLPDHDHAHGHDLAPHQHEHSHPFIEHAHDLEEHAHALPDHGHPYLAHDHDHQHPFVTHDHPVTQHDHPVAAHDHEPDLTVPEHDHAVPSHEHEVATHEHVLPRHGHEPHGHPLESHEHPAEQHEHPLAAHEHDVRMPTHGHEHEHELPSHGHQHEHELPPHGHLSIENRLLALERLVEALQVEDHSHEHEYAGEIKTLSQTLAQLHQEIQSVGYPHEHDVRMPAHDHPLAEHGHPEIVGLFSPQQIKGAAQVQGAHLHRFDTVHDDGKGIRCGICNLPKSEITNA